MGQGSSCGCGKAPNLGGRIIQTSSNLGSTSNFFHHNCHGHMASTFSRKYLVCFYCNKKSGIKYDGLMTQWDCARCEASNFLDENGDITDPPVATNSASPPDLKYSIARPDSPLSQTSQGSDAPFCSTCLKNQHLLISSLAQYHVETDPSHPKYMESERQYFKYRKSVEKRYPQCCEDCEARAVQGMKGATKTAQNDYVRKLMDKSRANRSAVRTNILTFDNTLDFVGASFWWIGLIGQLLWNISMVSAFFIEQDYVTPLSDSTSPLPFISPLLSTVLALSSYLPPGRSLALWGFWCSAFAFWWNPKFNQLNRGFVSHITGFGDWYKHQFILLVVRGLFYFVTRKEDFAENLAAATAGAHSFIALFHFLLAIRSRRFIKVNVTKLWNSTPERFPFVGPRGSPNQKGESMEDILSQIGRTPTRNSRPAYTPSPPYSEPFRPPPYQAGSIRVGHERAAPIQSLKGLDLSSFRGRTSPPLFNSTYTAESGNQPSLDQQYSGLNLGASMDWSPSQPASQPKSQHRAFTENLPVDKDAEFFGRVPTKTQPTKLFGQSPVVQASTFWYKVPPAPITPAHQLRNPPNQPRMRVASQERKENFFNTVIRKGPSWQESVETTNNSSQRQGIDFAQQKFFAPTVPSEEHDELAEAFGGWSLTDLEKPKTITEKKSRMRHIWQSVFLFFLLIIWNHAMNNPAAESTIMATFGVMFSCFWIGGRTILDNTMWVTEDKGKDSALAHSLAAILGGLELSAAIYGMGEIMAGKGDCKNCGSLGTILVGGMMVYDLWLASFG